MWMRRAYFYALWAAVFVLPLWVFLGRAFFGAPLGYQFLAQVVLVPLLFVAQLVATLVVFLRSSVRRTRAVSWIDVGVLTLSWVGQLGIGFFLVDSGSSAPAASAFTALVGAQAASLSTALSATSIVLTIVAGTSLLVLGIWQAVTEARAGLRASFADIERVANATTAQSRGFAGDPEHTIRITPRS